MKRHIFALIFTSLISAPSIAWASGSCPQVLVPRAEKALEDLQRVNAIAIPDMKIENGRARIKIGFLNRDASTFNRIILRALKAGVISEIDTGTAIGPKVLILLNRLKSVVSDTGEPILIHGTVTPGAIHTIFKQQLEGSRSGQATGARYWTENELRDYDQAIKDLKLDEACRNILFQDFERCGYLNFKFQTGPGPVEWTRHPRLR